MLILSIETTGEVCSIAVVDDSGIVAERAFRHRMRLLERLVPDTLAVLEDADASLGDVDAFAVGIGPGSFTGVRVGVMTAKTWADALAKPIVGVDSLTAIAEEHSGGEGPVLALVRARPGQVYAAMYALGHDCVAPLGAASLLGADDIAEAVAATGAPHVTVCGDGLRTCGDAIVAALGAAGTRASIGRPDNPRASTVAQIARSRIAGEQTESPLSLVPCYIAAPAIKVKTVRDPWAQPTAERAPRATDH